MNELHDITDDALERLFEVAGVITDAMKHELEGVALTPARAEIVWRVGERGPMTQRELADMLRCTPRNVTGLVDALEGMGLVSREPHPTDRRATFVTLTDEGRRTAERWNAGYRQLARHLFGDMEVDALAAVVTTLDRIIARLREPATDLTPPGPAQAPSQ